MGLLKIRITRRKDGRESAWFRDVKGRVRTSSGPVSWIRAGQFRLLGEFAIARQLGQCAAGIGSDGQAMPPLKGGTGIAIFTGRTNGKAQFERRSYAAQK